MEKDTASVFYVLSLTRLALQKELMQVPNLDATSAKVHTIRISSAWVEDPVSKPKRDRPI